MNNFTLPPKPNPGISLYIHFPFCVKKCAYCAFFSRSGAGEQTLDAYRDAVAHKILTLPRHRVKSVYYGGGTPTVFGAKRLCGIQETIFKTQDVEADAEITLEANPGTMEKGDARRLRNAGFNRLSLGLQSADDGILRAIGRAHTFDDFCKTYDDAARYFTNLSADIIFALPGGGLGRTLDAVKRLGPAHVSAYSLTLEPGTPLYGNQKNVVFPDEDEEEAEYARICETLSGLGYGHYEISSFAKSGFESRHNLGYWLREDYIGIGPSAHSFYKNRRFAEPCDTDLFIKNAKTPLIGGAAFENAMEITEAEGETERIMLGLRTAYGARLSADKLKIAEKFAASGFGQITGDVFALTSKGFRVSNRIIRELA